MIVIGILSTGRYHIPMIAITTITSSTAQGGGSFKDRTLQERWVAVFPNYIHDDAVDIWNRALATFSCAFSRPHLPKALRTQQCFNIFKWKPSSRCSLVHILSTSSSKSAPSPALFFLTMFMWNRALATVLRASCRPHLQKVLRGPQFLTIFCEIELLLQLQSCAHFVGHLSRSSRETTETETLLRRPRQPLYPKK